MEERDGERRRAFIGTSPLLSPPHEPLGTSNIQHPTPNRQSMALETIGCSMLDVGCWMFSFGSGVQCAKFSGNSLPEPADDGRARHSVRAVHAFTKPRRARSDAPYLEVHGKA